MRLENLDFEQSGKWWDVQSPGAGGGFVTNAGNARSGSTYMKLVSTSAGGNYPTALAADQAAGTSDRYVPVVPGQSIQYGGWTYRESGAGIGWIAGVAYDANKANPVYFNIAVDATVGSWKFQQSTYKVPAGKFFIQFYVQLDPNGTTTMRFDDVFFSPALDIQITTNAQVTDHTAYLRHQSASLKLNTFDFMLVDPLVIPALGDAVVANDPNVALTWSGVVSKVGKRSVSEHGGHTIVTISATNLVVALATVAPFDLGGTREWLADPGFEDADIATTQTFWDFGIPGEMSLDTVNFHGGAKSLLDTNTRQDSIQGGVWWHNWNAIQPHMPGGVAEPGIMGTQDVFAVAPGQMYNFSAWSKASAGSRANHMKVLWLKDLAGNYSDIRTTDFGTGLPNGGDGAYGWTLCSISAVAPQDARYAVLELMSGNWGNILSVNQASLETGTTGWAATLNCAIAQTAAQAFAGTKSLSLTSTIAGRMDAATPAGVSGFPVVPGDQFTASAYFRAAANARNVHVYIYWFQSGGAASAIRANDAFAGADITTGWTQVVGTVNAPSDAAFAQVVVSIDTTGAGAEVHYVDAIGFTHGSSTVWPDVNAQNWWDDVSVKAAAPFKEMAHDVTLDSNAVAKAAASCLIFQGGLWPAQTVAVTNSDYGLVNESFSVVDTTVTWPATPDKPVYRIDMGDPMVTLASWTSQQIAESFPIDSTKISDGAVSTPKLAANAVTADKIAAGSITADKLTAVFILASLIRAGAGTQHVEFDQNGLRAYDAAGNIVVNIPNDGSPVTVNATLIGQTLSVLGNAVLRGTLNELALGGILQLDGQVNDPTQAPILAASWPSSPAINIDGAYDISGSQYTRLGAHYDSAGGAGGATSVWLQVTNKNNGGHEYLLEVDTNTHNIVRALDLGVGGSNGVNPLSVCRLGAYIYVLSADKSAGSGGSANLGQTGGVSGDYAIGFSGGPNEFGMGTYAMPEHGTLVSITVDCGANSGTVAVRAVLWNSAGTILAQSSDKTLGVGHSPQTFTMSPVDLPAGTSYFIGIFAANSAAKRVGVKSTGSLKYKANQGSPSAFTGTTVWSAPDAGDMQAYLTYNKVTAVTTYRVRRYAQSTLALDATYDSAVSWPIATPVSPVMCSDGTNLFVVDKPAGTGTIVWNKYDAVMVKVGSTIDTTYSSGSGDVVNACAAGNFDFGAFRVACATVNGIETFSSTGVRQANETFPVPGGRAYGLGYGDPMGDGARFWSFPQTGGGQVSMTRHTTWTWTTASAVYWAGYTWYDDVGTVHETKISPRSSLTLGRRQALGITSQQWPGSGGADEPDSYNPYLYNGASDPGVAGLKRQATSRTALTYTAESYNGAGAADPATNNFPAGSAAELKSQTGGLSLKGDGKARFNNDMPHYHNNALAGYATATLVAKHMGNGSSLSITPLVTGRVRFRCSWDISDDTAGKTTITQAIYGTGTAPAQGAAQTGTVIGDYRAIGFTLGTYTYDGSVDVEVTGLTLGTAYWFDLIVYVNGGTGTWSRVHAHLEEF